MTNISLVATGLTVCVVLGLSDTSSAQFDISLMGGYHFSGGVEGVEADIDVLNGITGTTSLEYRFSPQASLELLYIYQDSGVEVIPEGLAPFALYDLTMHTMQLGVLYTLADIEWWEPFAAVTLGATIFDVDALGVDTETRFSAGFGGGIKKRVSDDFGLRMEGRLITPFGLATNEIFCRPPELGGCEITINESKPLYQGTFAFGFFFRLD